MSVINIFTAPNNLTLKRPTAPTVFVNGLAQEVARGSVTFTGSVQPVTGIELKNLSELQRSRDPKMVITETELRVVDVTNKIAADIVEYEGKDYIVEIVEELDDFDIAGLAHYEVTMIRKDKT
jgi:hypothetical protein